MTIKSIHSYLVPAYKGKEGEPIINGASVPLSGKLYELLRGIYERVNKDCKIDISFNISDDGTQFNAIRELLISHLSESSELSGNMIAKKLAISTTNRSGLGLLFLIVGEEADRERILVSRFPADHGILAEQVGARLDLSFIEKVFMKNSNAFKTAFYEDSSRDRGFWKGRAIDKQINSKDTDISEYWIHEFLESDFMTTSAEGSRRLGLAMRKVMQNSDDMDVKKEISAAVTLSGGYSGRTLSVEDYCEQMGFSDKTKEAIQKEIKNTKVMAESFKFDSVEFGRQVQFKSMELNTGAILSAPADSFDTIFEREMLGSDGKFRFATVGHVVDERFRKVK
ncbi:hypothetical protein ACFELO_10820 [Oceanicaulis sp. LC35]|uniref:hypothetical protein n=1 Tax=Oceanicaulis sp. LC35 TaxID=3349635 RepID=UPI003F87666D